MQNERKIAYRKQSGEAPYQARRRSSVSIAENQLQSTIITSVTHMNTLLTFSQFAVRATTNAITQTEKSKAVSD